MRIDKFLKNSRLIKRRTVAKQACESGRISVNDRVVKAGYEVNVGDIIEIRFGDKAIKAKVRQVNESSRKDDAKEMIEYLI